MHHGGKDSGALTGEAVDGAEDTESTPAGRDRGGMKTVAGAAGDAGAGEGEAPAAAAKAAAVLCCAGAEARVRSQGVERRMARKAVPAPRQPRAGGGLWGGRKGTKKLKESAGVGGEGAVQAHRSSGSAEAWALAGRCGARAGGGLSALTRRR